MSIQVRAFSSSEKEIGRFCRSAGAILGSRAPMAFSERSSIRAAVLIAGTDKIGTSRIICNDRSLARATSLAISRSPHTKSAKAFRLEGERSNVSKPSPDEVARTEFHSLKFLKADAGIEYARRIGVLSGSPLTRITDESWRPALLFPQNSLTASSGRGRHSSRKSSSNSTSIRRLLTCFAVRALRVRNNLSLPIVKFSPCRFSSSPFARDHVLTLKCGYAFIEKLGGSQREP